MCPCLCLASTEINIFFRPLGQTLLRTLGNRVHIAQNECLVLGVQIFFSAQSCPTLCDPVDYSPPAFSMQGWLMQWLTKSLETVMLAIFLLFRSLCYADSSLSLDDCSGAGHCKRWYVKRKGRGQGNLYLGSPFKRWKLSLQSLNRLLMSHWTELGHMHKQTKAL